MSELGLPKLVVHFAQSKRAEGKSPVTVTWYSDMLNSFIKFLEITDRRTVLSEFNVINIREFRIHEQGRLVSPFTVQGKVRH